MSVSDDWGVPRDSYLLILHHPFRLMLIPALCFHFDTIVPAYIQVQLGTYMVVPVKVLICCLCFAPWCDVLHSFWLGMAHSASVWFLAWWCVCCSIWCSVPDPVLLWWVLQFPLWVQCASSIWMIVLHPCDPCPEGPYESCAIAIYGYLICTWVYPLLFSKSVSASTNSRMVHILPKIKFE